NQAVSPDDQVRNNAPLRQETEYRDIRALIRKKSMQLQGRLSAADRWRLRATAPGARLLQEEAAATPEIASGSVQLTVTSPPFLDVVQYARDNWLRCWFNGFDAEKVGQRITMSKTVEDWEAEMAAVFAELHRITKPGGWVAFEVGEVRRGTVKLDEIVAPIGIGAGFECAAILINAQRFTKTANIWGVKNNSLGTNSNRIVLFRKT
ncbi:MAG: site-specific DNA-methyltransferase, partial [Pseudomonadota bacterium]